VNELRGSLEVKPVEESRYVRCTFEVKLQIRVVKKDEKFLAGWHEDGNQLKSEMSVVKNIRGMSSVLDGAQD
jgi:hypothetical protein